MFRISNSTLSSLNLLPFSEMISLSPELTEITQSVALLDFIITMMLISFLFYKELLKTFLRLLIAKKLI